MDLADKPSKSQIQLFFSEALATRTKHDLSEAFRQRVKAFDVVVEKRLSLLAV
jgi:hypothetical protein